METNSSLANEIARQHNITAEGAQNLLDGIDAGKAGGTEAQYIMALEARDKVIEHLSNVIERHGIVTYDREGNKR